MKKMKIVSGLMAMTMSILSVGMVANAADPVKVTIGKDNPAKAGDAFSVDVSLAGVPAGGLSSIDFAINYDDAVIDVTDVKLGAVGNTGAADQEGEIADTLYSWYDTGSQIVIVWATGLTDSSYWVSKDGVFVTISGTVDANAKDGDSTKLTGVAVDREAYPGGAANDDIVFSAVGATETVDYSATFTNGLVTVGSGSGGDTVDGDWGNVDCSEGATVAERVTVADAVLLSRLVANDAEAGNEVSEQGLINAQCVYDEFLNAEDLTALLKYLAQILDYSELGPQ